MKRLLGYVLMSVMFFAIQGCANDNSVLLGDPEGATAVQFTSDSRYLIASSFGGVSIWDARTRKKKWTFGGFDYGGEVDALSLSKDGKYLLSSHRYGLPTIWSMDTKKLLRTIGEEKGIRLVRFSPDSRRFVTGSEDTLRFWTFEGVPLWEKQFLKVCAQWPFLPTGVKLPMEGSKTVSLPF